MASYMFLIRGGDPDPGVSAEEVQQIIQKYVNWSNKLQEQGKLQGADKLAVGGRILRGEGGQVVDGPFTETKETIGGYFQVEARSYDEAVAMARECPVFELDGMVEVRQIEVH